MARFVLPGISAWLAEARAVTHLDDWWPTLQNPIVGYEDWSIKDAYIVVEGETCYAFFSAFYPRVVATKSHVVGIKGERCQNWSEPFLALDGQEAGWLGVCSPSVKPNPAGWVLAYNSWGDKKDQPNQLIFRTSLDLETWSEAQPLASSLTAGARFIDADATYDGSSNQWVLLSKGTLQDSAGKHHTKPKMFVSTDGLAGTWTDVANLTFSRADGSTTSGLENWDMFQDGQGTWRILATSLDADSKQLPILFTQAQPGDFSHWFNGTILSIPEQHFNTAERANAAAISTDMFKDSGHYLLVYAGATEKLDFAGRGNNKLGIARSTDLYSWEVAPDGAVVAV